MGHFPDAPPIILPHRSDYEGLAGLVTVFEPLESKGSNVDERRMAGDEFSDNPASGRGMHEPMATKPVGAIESRAFLHRSNDGGIIRRHLI